MTTTPDWVQDAIFYQIFPDRFARSAHNPNDQLTFETWDSPPTSMGFKGGDLYGVAERLDYLKDLGIYYQMQAATDEFTTRHGGFSQTYR